MLCPSRDIHDCATVIRDGKPLSDGGCTYPRWRNIGDGDSPRSIGRPLGAVIHGDGSVHRKAVDDR